MSTTSNPPLSPDVLKRKFSEAGADRSLGDMANAEWNRAFASLATTNKSMLDQAGSEGLRASDMREFEANTASMVELKTIRDGAWCNQRAAGSGVPFHDDPAQFGPGESTGAPDRFVVGRTKGRIGIDDDGLRSAYNAVAEREHKAIDLAGAPMAGVSAYDMAPIATARDSMRLLDLLPSAMTDRSKTTYFRATTPADAAAAVAAGGIKPESDVSWQAIESPIVKIAHWGKAHDEVVADFADFAAAIGDEYIGGLIDAETDQLLNGSGVGANMTGLLNTPGIQVQPFSTNIIETLAKGVTKLRTGPAKAMPDVFVLHPEDWEAVALFRVGGSTTTDGAYVVNPLAGVAYQLWGTPVIVTTRIAAGTAMVANLEAAARAWIRQMPRLELAPGQSEVEWKTNVTLIRAEERLGLEVPRPGGIVSTAVVAPAAAA